MVETHDEMSEVAVKLRIILLVMTSLTNISMNSSITPPERGVSLITIASLGMFPVA